MRLLMELLSERGLVRWDDPEPGPVLGLLGGFLLGLAVSAYALVIFVTVVWWGA